MTEHSIKLPNNQGTLKVRVYQQATQTRTIDITLVEFSFDDADGDRRWSVEMHALGGTPQSIRASEFRVTFDNHDTVDWAPKPVPESIDTDLVNEILERLQREEGMS